MTKREQEILIILKENPLISQQELANMLGIKRSSVGVHLSNLLKKGYLKGKGYIINEAPYLVVLGGANVDIVGFTDVPLVLKDSNQGTLKISMGGVGRNIAENLVRLGLNTKLISVIGDDTNGRQLKSHSQQIGLDILDSLFLKNQPTSVHLAIMDEHNDMALGLSAMNIYNQFSLAFIKKKHKILQKAKCIVLDTNMPKIILDEVATNYHSQKLFLDAVAGSKALRAKDLLKYLHLLKVNRLEAEILSGLKIKKITDVSKLANYFHKIGVKNVCITLGSDGAFYSNAKIKGFIKPQKISIINANGAGDAFMAGFIFYDLQNKSLKESATFGMACAAVTLEHEDNVHPELQQKINTQIKILK
ncbi:carbohydrate kinase [Lutibacter sp.]|uniref:carbohydrate kinase n=1 Tax=Lutibacter sp. TaxID=1925666 RepID=UPI0025B928E2|nr:carbohydrate kinase [Lutibacter sp.]MCF6182299.1 winged helix-turn-helix transcriptional regulator [Lutibacter sp.]